MEKTWFIFQEDHHLGPFSTSEIRDMLEQRKISPHAPLWREGIDDWYPLEHYSEFSIEEEEIVSEDLELPELPELPPLPISDDLEQEVNNIPAPVPEEVDGTIEELVSEVGKAESIDLIDLPDLPELPEIPEVGHEEHVEDSEKLGELISAEESVKEVIEDKSLTPVEEVSTIEVEQEVLEKPVVSSSEDASEVNIVDEDESREDIDQGPEGIDWEELKSSKKALLNNKIKTWAAAIVCFVVLSSSFLYLRSTFDANVDFEGLLPSQVEKVYDIRKQDFSENFQAKIFVSKDNKKLFLATNLPHEAKVYLTLSSVEKKVIGNGEVVVTANSVVKGGVATFSKLSLIKGEKFLPGEYYIKLNTIPVGISQRLSKFLHHKLKLSFIDVSKTHKYRGKDFIFEGTREEFDYRLKTYFAKELENKKIPYKDQLEKYRTFSQMSLRIYKIYEEVLTAIRRGKDIESFELLYAKEAGPILQSVILDTHSLFKEYEFKNASISSSYEEVLEHGKKIGEMASDMVTMTRKLKRLRKKNRERLLKLFKKRSKYLSEEAATKAKETNKLIHSLKL